MSRDATASGTNAYHNNENENHDGYSRSNFQPNFDRLKFTTQPVKQDKIGKHIFEPIVNQNYASYSTSSKNQVKLTDEEKELSKRLLSIYFNRLNHLIENN